MLDPPDPGVLVPKHHAVKHQGHQPPCGYYANATLQDWGTPETPKSSFLVGKPMVSCRNPPCKETPIWLIYRTKNHSFTAESLPTLNPTWSHDFATKKFGTQDSTCDGRYRPGPRDNTASVTGDECTSDAHVCGIHPWGVKIASDGRDSHLKSKRSILSELPRTVKSKTCPQHVSHFLSNLLTLLILFAVSKLGAILNDACLGTTDHRFSTHLWGRSG